MITYLVQYRLKGDNPRKDLKTEHVHFLNELYEQGTLICAGVLTDQPGGYLLFKTNSLDQTKEIIEQDPYIIHHAREYEIKAWDMSPFPLKHL